MKANIFSASPNWQPSCNPTFKIVTTLKHTCKNIHISKYSELLVFMEREVTSLDFQNEVSFDVLYTDESSEAHLKNDAAVKKIS